ncbi:pentapeptide repeat-containing protein [Vibrio parahaemolyticus]|nr:pentapeptide repeat-containing protein [Vibrio parahaemolyticus]
MKETSLEELKEVLHYSQKDIRLGGIYVKSVDMGSLLKEREFDSLDLSFSVFEDCSFDGLNLSNTDFYGTTLDNCSLVDTELKGSNIEMAKIKKGEEHSYESQDLEAKQYIDYYTNFVTANNERTIPSIQSEAENATNLILDKLEQYKSNTQKVGDLQKNMLTSLLTLCLIMM